MKRCAWVNMKNPLYIDYHDNEWGVPLHDEKRLYEMLILESFQAGLSWECVLNKRQAFRDAYDDFDIEKVVSYDDKKVEELLANPSIIRNKLKIKASINNSIIFKSIQREFGSFDNYIWHFTKEATVVDPSLRATSPLSDEISEDLKRRGMKFVGSVIIYSYLQAVGILNSHQECCDLCKKQGNIE